MSGDKSDVKRNWSALAMSSTKALAYNSEEYESSPVPGVIDLWGDDGARDVRDENHHVLLMSLVA